MKRVEETEEIEFKVYSACLELVAIDQEARACASAGNVKDLIKACRAFAPTKNRVRAWLSLLPAVSLPLTSRKKAGMAKAYKKIYELIDAIAHDRPTELFVESQEQRFFSDGEARLRNHDLMYYATEGWFCAHTEKLVHATPDIQDVSERLLSLHSVVVAGALPNSVVTAVGEARRCYACGSLYASVAMARTAMEAAVRARVLKSKIDAAEWRKTCFAQHAGWAVETVSAPSEKKRLEKVLRQSWASASDIIHSTAYKGGRLKDDETRRIVERSFKAIEQLYSLPRCARR